MEAICKIKTMVQNYFWIRVWSLTSSKVEYCICSNSLEKPELEVVPPKVFLMFNYLRNVLHID